MKILALEFSANERSVAVATRGDAGALTMLASEKETSREVTGLALIDRAMAKASLAPAEITHIILGLGPGSYTGIRSAIALAQGWQLGRGVQVIGISSVECLAGQAHELGMRGEVSLVVDAQRGDVYHQVFRLTDDAVEQLTKLCIVPANEIKEQAKVVGPDASRWVPGATNLAPSAGRLVQLVKVGEARPAEDLEPIYLREAAFVKAPEPRRVE